MTSAADLPGTMHVESRSGGGYPFAESLPAAISFVTTEHFTLQGARSSTVAESTGRASIFLASVSGGLVGLGFIGQQSQLGPAFYAFALVLLPTLAFVGMVTFDRVLQSGIEDLGYANRIAQLRAFYFHVAPEIRPYLMSVAPEKRLAMQGLRSGRRQGFLTIAGMIAVITSVIVGTSAGLLAAVLSNHAWDVTFATGGGVALAAVLIAMRYQARAWREAGGVAFNEVAVQDG